MAKRFHDTDIWNEDWFIELPKDYQQFWFFIKDDCDHAGIWRPQTARFNTLFRAQVDLNEALELFNADKDRVTVLPGGRWFINGFIPFQYGTRLNLKNKVHNSIYQLLNFFEVDMTSIKPLLEVSQGVKEKDKEKDKDKEKSLKSLSNKSSKTRFTPPTVEQVAEYCKERGNNIDPQYFVDSNTTKGWVVGKNRTPMKDWKAAIRTWENNNGNSGISKNQSRIEELTAKIRGERKFTNPDMKKIEKWEKELQDMGAVQ